MTIEKILIVTDNNPPSVKAVEYGFALAKYFDAKVMLFGEIEVTQAVGNPDAGIFPDDAAEISKANTEHFLAQMIKTRANGVEAEYETSIGDVHTAIVSKATDWDADLIIAGTNQRTGLSRLLHQNTAENVIRHSPIPVLIIPVA
jgi:nucleotide-binding universal stress UspA family protein